MENDQGMLNIAHRPLPVIVPLLTVPTEALSAGRGCARTATIRSSTFLVRGRDFLSFLLFVQRSTLFTVSELRACPPYNHYATTAHKVSIDNALLHLQYYRSRLSSQFRCHVQDNIDPKDFTDMSLISVPGLRVALKEYESDKVRERAGGAERIRQIFGNKENLYMFQAEAGPRGEWWVALFVCLFQGVSVEKRATKRGNASAVSECSSVMKWRVGHRRCLR